MQLPLKPTEITSTKIPFGRILRLLRGNINIHQPNLLFISTRRQRNWCTQRLKALELPWRYGVPEGTP
jgi:hypothetical protein